MKLMKSTKKTIQLVVIALTLTFSASAFGHDNRTIDGPSIESHKVKLEGLVTKRDDGGFTVRTADGTETVVVLTDKTTVKINRRFRPDKTTAASDILRGLRLKVEGTSNNEGQLIASKVRFEERDLLTAQAVESRVSPVESQANSTESLAESNEKKIDYAQQRIEAADQNAQRLAGQIEELSVVAEEAGANAKTAQDSADKAQAAADTANDRISNLDQYAVFRTITVHFRSGSAALSKTAKQELDQEIAALIDLNGYAVSVVGFADATGKAGRNRSLSSRRAASVINYLVTQHNLPLERIIQPFGYGSLNPVSSNSTGEGRALNRRAQVRILINKGITQASL
jgi:OmpA-OmpF porin, OOP family